MSRSRFWNYVQTASAKIAEYTGYVHLITYLAIWLCLVSFLGLASLSAGLRFFIATFLGAAIAPFIGVLFWFFPSLIIKWKKRKGKNWSGLLAVINIGLLRFVVLPCITLAIFFFIAIPMIKSVDSDRRSNLENSHLASESDCGHSTDAEIILFEKTKTVAEKGDPDAQTKLGFMYSRGEGVPQDTKEAVKWYQTAANQGHPRAQYNLATCYDDGRGVKQDYKEAFKWYTFAAEQEYASAYYGLGVLYDNGNGVSQDYGKAIKWYILAANQGDTSAQNNLGVIYREGEGALQNYGEAFKWFKLASDQGEATAQCSLGFQYFNGLGVEKNIPEAVKWYILAADQGNQMAKKSLKSLKKTLSSTELDQGKKLVETWRKNHD